MTDFSPSTKREVKYQLVLVRHGESEWNVANRFTGWRDVPLSEKGLVEAKEAGKLLRSNGFEFDQVYTSVLQRAIKTMWIALEEMNLCWIPVTKTWRLNERHYGALQGLNKQETVARHGLDQVMIWRRSYATPPPALDDPLSSADYPGQDSKYQTLLKLDQAQEVEWPVTESLKMTLERVLPYWNSTIKPAIVKDERKVLIVAHGNSLRALVKELDGIPEDEITSINIPTGIPLVYELDAELKPVRHAQAVGSLSGHYLGDQDHIRARIEGVANQTKA